MEYPINLYTVETTDGIEWVAEYPDVKGCVGGGQTPEEALAEAKDNLEILLEFLQESGKTIPEPSKFQAEYSGKLSLRISKSLHAKVAKEAKKEGSSINAFISEALASYIGEKQGINPLTDMVRCLVDRFKNRDFTKLSNETANLNYSNTQLGGGLLSGKQQNYRC